MPRLSVIIPTLNESAFLPALLDALFAQTRPADEIIVADAGSTDGTADLARARGVMVVPGGLPGPGRNAGARAATGDLFFFLDADVLPRPDFFANAVDEFLREGYAVATCPVEALSDDLTDKVIIEASNLYLQVIQSVSPRAPGFCILVRREVHEAIGGFDETLKMAEDHDYVRRAAQHGEFGMLTSVRIPVSMRRLDKEGIPRLALKYLWCEMHALAKKPIRSMPFEYEFGAFQSQPRPGDRTLIDVGELRTLLGTFENPIYRLSRTSLDYLRRLTDFDPFDVATDRLRLLLDRPDLEALERYLMRRLVILRRGKIWQRGIKRLAALPKESIRLLEPALLSLRRPLVGMLPRNEDDKPD